MEVRLVGALLRHHREAARWSLREAAAELECDTSKISRIETGHRRPVPGEMLTLLAAYGVSRREQQAIAALTQNARAGWWGEYRGLLPDGMVDHALLESVADDVLVYDPQALPAFLQTCRYAEAVAAADPALRTDEERRLAVLLSARRAGGLRDRPDTTFTVVLSEAALRQQVGGSEVMLGQLRQIADGAEKSPVLAALQVVPLRRRRSPGHWDGPAGHYAIPGCDRHRRHLPGLERGRHIDRQAAGTHRRRPPVRGAPRHRPLPGQIPAAHPRGDPRLALGP